MKRFLKTALYSLAALVVLGSGVLVYWSWPRTQELLTDADTIRIPTEEAVVRDVVWQPATPVGDINSSADDYEVEISSDGGTMFVVRGRPGENADIHVAYRKGASWSETKPLGIINTPEDELGPVLSSDGRSLYFYSNRPGGLGGYDLWVSRRGDAEWREPANLGPAVNSAYDDYGPALPADGSTLYFASNRPKPDEIDVDGHDTWSATLRADRRVRDFDLYSCALSETGPLAAAPLAALNSPFDEGAPAVSPFGDFLYFASNRPGGLGGYDIYRSRLRGGRPGEPESLGPTINTAMNELDPRLSLGGYGLYFSSDRGRGGADRLDNDANAEATAMKVHQARPAQAEQRLRDYDVFYSASREVFREMDTSRAAIDWAALWAAIGPNLAWALLALLLIALLLALMRDFKNRQLSLLARCLFASLIAHLALLLLFNVWQVGSAVATAFKGRGEIKISLVSTAVGETISTQIRGALTEAATPAAQVADATAVEFSHRPMPVEMNRVDTRSMVTPMAPVEPAASAVRTDVSETADATVESEIALPIAVSATEREHELDPAPIAESLTTPVDSPRERTEEAALVVSPRSMHSEPQPTKPSFATSQPAMERVELEPAAAMTVSSFNESSTASQSPASQVTDSPLVAAVRPPKLDPSVSSGVSASTVPLDALALPRSNEPELLESAESTPRLEAEIPGHALATPVRVDVDHTRGANQVAVETTKIMPVENSSIGSASTSVVRPSTTSDARVALPQLKPNAHAEDSAIVTSVSPLAFDFQLPADDRAAAVVPNEAAARSVTAAKSDAKPADALGVLSPQPVDATVARSDIRPADSNIVESTLVGDAVVDDAARESGNPDSTRRDASNQSQPVESSAMTIQLALPSDSDLVGGGRMPPDAIGIIRGRVTEQATGRPSVGARVRLVLPDHADVEATTSETGEYSLFVPAVPNFFALSASQDGFVPRSVNVRAADLGREPVVVDFRLEPLTDLVIALEESPDVHHLGNDQFEGRINSQFQKQSEGRIFLHPFQVTEAQLAPAYSRAEIRLLARGVQCPHQIRINGRLLRSRLDRSPNNGSFGEFTAEFDPLWLLVGENTFKIRAQSCRGDLDDFEFVNIQIRLVP